MSKKFGLILGSGGSRGFAHIGFLQALEENGIKPDVLTGCSIGSVIGAVYLTGLSPRQMKNIAFRLKKNDLIDVTLNVFKKMSVLKSAKLEQQLFKYIGNKTFADLPIPFATIATDLVTGKLVTFTDGDLLTAVKASSSIPAVFSPVKKDGMFLVDGGLLSRTPVAAAKDLGAEVTVAVDLLGNLPEYTDVKNIIQLAVRAIDVGDHRDQKLRRRDTPDLMLNPDLKGISQYKIDNQQFCYDTGYQLGLDNVERIKELIG